MYNPHIYWKHVFTKMRGADFHGLGAVFPGLGADLPGGCFLSMVYIIFSHVRCDPLI